MAMKKTFHHFGQVNLNMSIVIGWSILIGHVDLRNNESFD
jgi:hypothetical protein